MSKYSWTEFLIGCRHYQGTRSPNNAEREVKGYSEAWLHHKGRNKHHMEYWIDYSVKEEHGMAGMEMPVIYVVEMFIDRVAASKTYKKEDYTQADPYHYFLHGKEHYMIHPKTEQLLEELLIMLAEKGENHVFSYIKAEILQK